MKYKKQLQCNYHDIFLAVKEAVRPMQNNIDIKNGIPFFINILKEGRFENSHHSSYSAAHVPGRWLNALFAAKEIIGISINEEVIRILTNCTYKIFNDTVGLPLCVDLETIKPLMVSDLHNLREYMYALYSLIRFRSDSRAYEIAMRVINTVDNYFDFENNIWNGEKFRKDTGCRTYIGPIKQHDEKDFYFPSSFGRYIEPLVKLYKYCGIKEALAQAIRLKDSALRHIMNGSGEYTPDTMGGHTHSVTSMVSSLALLSKTIGDHRTMREIIRFLETSLKEIALDFGWCIENYYREDLIGEINNTSDILRTYLILGETVDRKYYNKAERMLRGHMLPAQLLDQDLLYDEEGTLCENPVMKGAFGFPCPYGYEYIEGRPICFNWDIVGGAVDGLCEAIKHMMTKKEGIIDINMLFGCETEDVKIVDPYTKNGVLEIIKKSEENYTVHINLSDNVCIEKIFGVDANAYHIGKNELWIFGNFHEVHIKLGMKKRKIDNYFRGKRIRFEWIGDMVTAADTGEKNLCFFKNLA